MVVKGVCGHDCPDRCAWRVDVQGGRAVRLAGDADHPFTRGTLCAKVNHYLERVYHPERVLFPLKRIGPKGEGRFARTSWDEALSSIAARWKAIFTESGPEALLPFSSAGTDGLIQTASLDRRLFGALGCSALERKICGGVATAGMSATLGSGAGIDPEDLVHSRFIIIWGTNPIVSNLHLWPFIREARQRGARVVVIDPVRTRTAEAADWHVQIRPGADAALALAMMHVMIREELIDRDYIDRYAVGFEALRARAEPFEPGTAAFSTGIPAEDIVRLAREYATLQPAVIRLLIGMEHHRNGAMMFRAIACLSVLNGSWRYRGGGIARSTQALHHEALNIGRVQMPEVWIRGVRTLNMRDLGADLCSGALHPPVKGLMIYNANPAVSIPDHARVRAGLLRDDLFTVVHDLFMTETARYADYVLPATSQIEHWDLNPSWGHLYLTLNRPAIDPLGESVCNTELFRRLAGALGRTEPWLFESDESMIRGALDSTHPWMQGITYERLEAEGYVRLNAPEDWRPFANGGFPTPSGKAELHSRTLEALGIDPLPAAGEIALERGLQLITLKSLHFLNSGYANMERHRRRAGPLAIHLHPADARASGVGDGDIVRVWNDRGAITVRCAVSTSVQRGVAWMPFGDFCDETGQRQAVNVLTPVRPTDWGGGTGFCDAFVQVARASARRSPH